MQRFDFGRKIRDVSFLGNTFSADWVLRTIILRKSAEKDPFSPSQIFFRSTCRPIFIHLNQCWFVKNGSFLGFQGTVVCFCRTFWNDCKASMVSKILFTSKVIKYLEFGGLFLFFKSTKQYYLLIFKNPFFIKTFHIRFLPVHQRKYRFRQLLLQNKESIYILHPYLQHRLRHLWSVWNAQRFYFKQNHDF